MRKSPAKRAFDVFNYTILTLILIATLYPLLNQIALSFSSTSGILKETVTIFPIDFTLDTYIKVFEQEMFWRNYLNTIIYTVSGTLIGLSMTTICAYALSKPIYGAGTFMKFIAFTIFFGGGLIPCYALIQKLHMMDTIWALIIPGAILPYHVMLMRTFFQGLPQELEEAARIDGLGQFGYFWRIALPLSKPILATMVLFIAVLYWNDWFSALIYINDPEAQPVTLFLRNLLTGANMAASSGDVDATMKTIPQSTQAASMILVTVPILCVYPFVQKHFVKGVMVGALKG